MKSSVAAAAQLGREHGFPGYLTQRADALEASGGPCSWDGLDRSRLTADQLAYLKPGGTPPLSCERSG